MSAYPNVVSLSPGMEKVTNSAKKHVLGTMGVTDDGRVFRYALNGATALAPGHFLTFITTPTNEQSVTVAHAIGTFAVTVTAAGISKDDFRDGYLVVTAGTGIGEMYLIKGNSATASSVIVVDLYRNDKLLTAWVTADTDVDLFQNPWNGLVVCPTDGQQLAVGLAVATVAASEFCWVQVKGVAPVFIDANGQAVGLELDEKNLRQSLNHAGQAFVDTAPDATKILAGYRQVLGYLITEEDVVDNEIELCMIDLT